MGVDCRPFWLRRYYRKVPPSPTVNDWLAGGPLSYRTIAVMNSDGSIILGFGELFASDGIWRGSAMSIGISGHVLWKKSGIEIPTASAGAGGYFASIVRTRNDSATLLKHGNIALNLPPWTSYVKEAFFELDDNGNGISYGAPFLKCSKDVTEHYEQYQIGSIDAGKLLLLQNKSFTGAAGGFQPTYYIADPNLLPSQPKVTYQSYVIDDAARYFNTMGSGSGMSILATNNANQAIFYMEKAPYVSPTSYEFLHFIRFGFGFQISATAGARMGRFQLEHHSDYGGGHFTMGGGYATEPNYFIDSDGSYYICGTLSGAGAPYGGFFPFVSRIYYDELLPGWTGWLKMYTQVGALPGYVYTTCYSVIDDPNDPSAVLTLFNCGQVAKIDKTDGHVIWARRPPHSDTEGIDCFWPNVPLKNGGSAAAPVLLAGENRIVWAVLGYFAEGGGARNLEIFSFPYEGGATMYEPNPRWKNKYVPWNFRALNAGALGDGDIPILGVEDMIATRNPIVREYWPDTYQAPPW